MEVDVGYMDSGMKVEYHIPLIESICRSVPEAASFTDTMRIAFASDVRNCWADLQAALQNHGLSATLASAERKVTISTSTRDPKLITMARDCVVLLCRVGAKPHKVIGVLNGELHYDYVKVAYHDGGIGAALGITEAEFKDRMRKFSMHAVDLRDLLDCAVYFTNEYVAAVGSLDAGAKQLRRFVDRCIVENEDPAEVFRVCDQDMTLEKKFEAITLLDAKLLDSNPDLELENENCVVNVDCLTNDVKISCVINRGRLSKKGLAVALEKHGFGLNTTADRTGRKLTAIATSRTDDQDLIDKVRDFLTLFCKTSVPIEKAISVLNDEAHCEYIEIGNQELGLCTIHRIRKKQFYTRLVHLKQLCKAIGDTLGYSIYVDEGTVVAIGKLADAGKLIRMIVTRCMRGALNPWKVSYIVRSETKKKVMSKLCPVI